MHHRAKHRSWIFSFVIVITTLAIATPALANYIGPNRTVTETQTTCKIVLNECQFVPDKNDYRFKNADSWSCSNESKPWQAYPNNPPRDCMASTVGDEYWSREEGTRTVTTTYPPATISSSLQNCTLQNGWCITVPYLSLSGSEPVAGHNIYAIEGYLNDQPFGCMVSSCNVPLIQGNNYFSYWALSSFTDSSEMGALTASVDSQLPNIAGTFTGTVGSNGWYVSPVSFNGSASDSTSGLASFTCSLDGISLASCKTIAVNNDGFHTLVLTARDNAGHIRTITQNASVDTQNPALNASISGTLGSNSWYTEALLNATASDPSPGSGLVALEYSLDGSGWTTFPSSGALNLSEGKHTVDLRAVDQAGRTVSSSRSFWLDRVTPGITLDSSGTIGLNGWYITSPTLTASANDSTSGIDVFDYSLDQGGWQTYTTPLRLDDGVHNISIWAQDAAGLVTQIDRVYHVDTRLPQIAGSLSGAPGANGWYISPVTIAVSASDPMPGSGMDTFTYILNENAETPYNEPLLLSNGQHTVQFNAGDKTGLSYSIEQNINVDTIPPSLNVETAFRDWVKDSLIFKGIASDGGSGLSKVEISLDGAQTWQIMSNTDGNDWKYTWDTLKIADGVYRANVRATDIAGLTTQHAFDVGVDNRAPEISLPESWFQWDAVTLDIWDSHSGLSEARVEITDPEGHWPKRVIPLDPKQFPLSFKWDRRFGDDTVAEAGNYVMTVTAYDSLGHTTTKSASITVLLDILPPGPTATPQPYIRVEPTDTPSPRHETTVTPSPIAIQTTIVHTFGVIEPTTAAVTPTPQSLPTPRATPTQSNVQDWLQSVFVPNVNQESTVEITPSEDSQESPLPAGTDSSQVLWGTAATAAIAAATAYAQEEKRKREEEKARQAQLEAQEEESRRKAKERKLEKIEAKRAQELAWQQAREEARLEREKLEERKSAATLARYNERMERLEAQEAANWAASQEAVRKRSEEKKKKEEEKKEAEEKKKKAQELQAGLEAYYNGRKEGETNIATPPAEKTWRDKTIDWVDDHQTEIAFGLGIVAGVAVIAITGGLAAPLVAAALVGGAAVAAGGSATLMTIGLNRHYARPWHENLLKNVAVAAGAAAVLSGAWFLLHGASTAIGGYCAVHQSTCARVEPVFNALDKVEETWLRGKLAYQTWRGDQAGAADTAFELHSEYLDGGMPGNAVAKELGEQLTDLRKNALPVINKYGQEVIPLLVKHGDEGLQLIQKFGIDGIALLQKHGNDATDLIHLDRDVLDYVMQQSDEAVAALCRWSAKDLREHGVELALRAQKDADVLAAIKKLNSSGPVDPKKLTPEQQTLIEEIAANSTQYGDNKQVVLGKWVDIDSGFVQTAQETGSLHYNPHPDMWTMLGKLGDAKQEQVAWLINKQVVQTGINKGLPFEYTLNGIPTDTIDNEIEAVEAIFSGKTEAEIKEILESRNLPIRMKELQELKKAGYEFTFDSKNNSYIFVKP